ncbi:MAG TPA: transglycosylase SLT domain-containing protein [Aquamicrobium sp.]|nr:transglycosylase SLT domain-containing protein [Aquamicrobium sp.]
MRKLIFATAALAAGLGACVSGATATALDIHATMRLQAEAAAATAGKGNKAESAIDHVTTASISAGKARSAVKARPTAGASAYDAIISRHAAQHGIPASLARAVVRIESNYRPNARGRAGEIGLMQIKPSTARMMGYSGSAKGLYDPETNIRWGMKYLARAHALGGGDTCGTILRYNAGHGAKRMNKVSAAYCARVKRHMGGA